MRKAEAQALRDEAEARAAAAPQPRCSVVGCDAPAHLPCHSCHVDLCAGHGRTRLLITHCDACAARDHGYIFFSHTELVRDKVASPSSPAATTSADDQEDDMATKAKGGKAETSKWGRKGTASEAYKRCIMDHKYSNAECYEKVKAMLGPKKAGKPTYAGWYRAKLKADGVKNVPASK